MKIYTRKGDSGTTGLLGGNRVSKDTARLELCGTLDELNAMLGLARAEGLPEEADGPLAEIQARLFELGADLASAERRAGLAAVDAEKVAAVERVIDRLDEQMPPLNCFILPGGTRAAATVHLARTVCRRAERRLVTLTSQSPEGVNPHALPLLNRLSDLLFVLARFANFKAGEPEVTWRP
jgi:cob(I)alamin adenosyltransferase